MKDLDTRQQDAPVSSKGVTGSNIATGGNAVELANNPQEDSQKMVSNSAYQSLISTIMEDIQSICNLYQSSTLQLKTNEVVATLRSELNKRNYDFTKFDFLLFAKRIEDPKDGLLKKARQDKTKENIFANSLEEILKKGKADIQQQKEPAKEVQDQEKAVEGNIAQNNNEPGKKSEKTIEKLAYDSNYDYLVLTVINDIQTICNQYQDSRSLPGTNDVVSRLRAQIEERRKNIVQFNFPAFIGKIIDSKDGWLKKARQDKAKENPFANSLEGILNQVSQLELLQGWAKEVRRLNFVAERYAAIGHKINKAEEEKDQAESKKNAAEKEKETLKSEHLQKESGLVNTITQLSALVEVEKKRSVDLDITLNQQQLEIELRQSEIERLEQNNITLNESFAVLNETFMKEKQRGDALDTTVADLNVTLSQKLREIEALSTTINNLTMNQSRNVSLSAPADEEVRERKISKDTKANVGAAKEKKAGEKTLEEDREKLAPYISKKEDFVIFRLISILRSKLYSENSLTDSSVTLVGENRNTLFNEPWPKTFVQDVNKVIRNILLNRWESIEKGLKEIPSDKEKAIESELQGIETNYKHLSLDFPKMYEESKQLKRDAPLFVPREAFPGTVFQLYKSGKYFIPGQKNYLTEFKTIAEKAREAAELTLSSKSSFGNKGHK